MVSFTYVDTKDALYEGAGMNSAADLAVDIEYENNLPSLRSLHHS